MSITPFLSLYFKQLGLSPFRIGTATFIKYICVSIFTPIFGLLMDTCQCRKLLIFLVGSFWIFSGVGMGFLIPEYPKVPCTRAQEDNRRISQCMSGTIELSFEESSSVNPRSNLFIRKPEENNLFDMCLSLNSTLASDRSWMYDPDSIQKVFIMILIGNSLLEMMFLPLHSIADAESVNTLEDMGIDIADYGKQRAFGSLGWGIT